MLETLGDTDSDNAPEYLREACEINLFLAAEQKDRPEFLAFGVSCLAQCLDALGEEAYSRRNLAALLDCFSNVYEALLDADKICLDQAYQSTFENSMELIEEWLECLRLGEHAAVLRYCQNKVIFGDNAD